MPIARPAHLQARQYTGAAFGEPVTFVRAGEGSYDANDEWIPGSTISTDMSMATAPGRVVQRQLKDSGVRIENVRVFWTWELEADAVRTGDTPASADQIIYQGTAYRVFQVDPWGDGTRIIYGTREDPQPTTP